MGRKAGLTAEDVIGAAADVADREGLDNLTLARVARDLGVRSPSLYNHVAGLDGVNRGLAMLGARHLRDTFTEARRGRRGEDALRAMCHAFRQFAADHPGLYAATLPGARLADDDEVWQTIGSALDIVAEALSELGLEGADQIHAIRVFRSAFHGFVTLERAEGFGLPASTDDSYDRLVDFFVQGATRLADSRP